MKSKKNIDSKKIYGSVLLIVGAALIVFGSIISGQVKQGDRKIHNAQRNVNTFKQVTKASPYTREIGKSASRSVQKKINAGRKKAGKFKGLSIVLLIVGIVSALSGATLLYLGFGTKKKRKR